MVRLGDINPTAWDKIVEYMEWRFQSIEFSGDDLLYDWKISANERKLEREIFAKYGRFKDIILHPTFQYYKQLYHEYVSWDFFLDEGNFLIPISTIVIVLVMLNKRVDNESLALIGAFLLNINPIYVVTSMILYWFFYHRSKYPKKYRQIHRKNLVNVALTNARDIDAIDISKEIRSSYDHVLIGNDLGTLYAAALLSRVGHQCIVLQPRGGLPLTFEEEGLPPIPLSNLSVGRPDRYQFFVDLVQSRKHSSEKVTFESLGASDGSPHTVLRVIDPHTRGQLKAGSLAEVATFSSGEGNIFASLSSITAIDTVKFKPLVDTIVAAHQMIAGYIVGKVLGIDKEHQHETLGRGQSLKPFIDLTGHDLSDVFDRNVENPLTHDLLNGLSVIGSDENLSSSEASGYGIASFFSSSEGGHHYPRGGHAGLVRAFNRAIRSAGGEILSNVSIDQIIIDEHSSSKTTRRATGVQLVSGMEFQATQSVVSGAGILATFTRLVPQQFVSSDIRSMLNPLIEAKPKLHVVYVVDGTSESLGLKSAEYVEVGSDYRVKLARWTGSLDTSPASSKDSLLIHSNYCRISCPSVQDPSWSNPRQVVVIEFELVEPAASLKPYRFSEAPAGESSESTRPGPKMYTSSYGSKPMKEELGDEVSLSRTQLERIFAHADKKLQSVYPLCAPRVVKRSVVSPRLGGFRLSSTPSKFGCHIGAVTDIENLYLTGRDIATVGLAGDIQSGWATVNAILGYSVNELILGRNVSTDLEHVPLNY